MSTGRAIAGRRPRPAVEERTLRRYVGWCRRRGRTVDAAWRLVELGYSLLWRAHLDEAGRVARQSLAVSDEAGIEECAIASTVLAGWVALPSEGVTAAEALARAALERARVRGPAAIGAAATLLVTCLHERGEGSELLGLIAEVPTPEPGLTPRMEHWAPGGLTNAAVAAHAACALASGDWAAAKRLQRVLEVAAPSLDPIDLAALGRTRCALAVADGSAEAAIAAGSEGLAAARRSHGTLVAGAIRLAVADACVRRDRLARARRMLNRLSRSALFRWPGLNQSLQAVRRHVDEGSTGDQRTSAPSVQLEASDVLEILRRCGGEDGERSRLAAVCASLRRAIDASTVVILAREAAAEPIASAGHRPALTPRIRGGAPSQNGSSAIGEVLATHRLTVPIGSRDEPFAFLCVKWGRVSPDHIAGHLALAESAAAAVAPLVWALEVPGSRAAISDGLLDAFAGPSQAVATLKHDIQQAASVPFPVVVEGESGCGKELVARAIHTLSTRRRGRFCAINCAALPDELCEAELFGHARGAFTGAACDRAGLFEEADGGTLMLDEIGELSPRAQAKLLRVLQEGEVRRLGENHQRRVDPRLVAATNAQLHRLASEGRFRSDLLFRLDVLRIRVPSLRERREDIPALAGRLWNDAAQRAGSRALLSAPVLAALGRHHWPGNVRELQNVLLALAAHAPRSGFVGVDRLPARLALTARASPGVTLEAGRRAFERAFVRDALARAEWRRSRAASDLGLTRQGLAKMMARLGIDEAGFTRPVSLDRARSGPDNGAI